MQTAPAVRRFGCQSMAAPLRTVIVRKPAPPLTGDEWEAFGYPRPVDVAAAEPRKPSRGRPYAP